MILQPDYTMDEYNTYCAALSRLGFQSAYIWSMISKVVSCFAALPIILYMILRRKFLVYNEPLIYYYAIVMFVYALDMFLATAMQIHALSVSKLSCDRIAYSTTCVYFKALNYANTFGISASMLGLSLDTGLCLLLDVKYQKLKRWLSHGILTVMIIIYVSILYAFYHIDSQADHLHIHCIEDSVPARPYALLFSMLQATMDALNIGLSTFLLLYCKKRLRSDRLNINRTFAVRHSLTLLSAFYPLTIYHGITLVLYNTAHGVLRFQLNTIDLVTLKNWTAFTNVLPYYAFGAPILLTVVLKKIKRRRDDEISHTIQPSLNGKVVPETNLYFEMLHKAWNVDTEMISVSRTKHVDIRKKSRSVV